MKPHILQIRFILEVPIQKETLEILSEPDMLESREKTGQLDLVQQIQAQNGTDPNCGRPEQHWQQHHEHEDGAAIK